VKRKGKHIAIAAGALALAILGMTVWSSWPYFRLWWLFEPLGPNAQGYPEYRQRKTGIIFVGLPGGKFLMGAQKTDPGAPNHDPDACDDEAPVHEVKLSPFLMAKFEVTLSEWERTMEANPSRSEEADFPVEVSWGDCQGFCAKAELELPTEAQWEYACRGGIPGPYAARCDPDAMAWYADNSEWTTQPVGKKEPNGFGLHDMHGNVGEWCEDAYDSGFYARAEACARDPCCVSDSGSRVARGGGWVFYIEHSGSTIRFRYNHDGETVGLRLASPPP